MMASAIHAKPYVIAKIEQSGGDVIYSHPLACCAVNENRLELSMIQEGLRGVVRLPSGTAHALDARSFPIPVMGKTGTTNNYRDALFVGPSYGPDGITVAVRIGFDDNCSLGGMETGGKAALPVFREVMLKTYQAKLVAPVPSFPANMENNIAEYLSGNFAAKEAMRFFKSPYAGEAAEERTRPCCGADRTQATDGCELAVIPLPVVYQRREGVARPFLRTSEERLPEARQQLRAESSAPWSVPHQPSLTLRRLRPQYYCLRLTRACREGQRAKIEVVRPPRGVNSPRTTHHSGRTAATMSWRILFTAFS